VLWAGALLLAAALDTDAFGSQPLRDRPVADGPGAVAHAERRNSLPTFIWAEGGPSLKDLGLTPEQAARRHLWTYAPRYRVSPATLAAAELWRVHDTGWGAVIVTFVQRREEVPVFRETLSVVMDRELRAVALTGYLSALPNPTKLPQLSQGTALAVALQVATGKWADPEAFAAVGTNGGWSRMMGPLLRAPAMVRPVLFALVDRLEPAFDLDLDDDRAVISSVDGRVLLFATQVNDAASYRAFADTAAPFLPWPTPSGPSTLPVPSALPDLYDPPYLAGQLVSLDNAGIATNDPWLPPNAMMLDGNNARAYADRSAPDGLYTADGGATSDVIIPATAPGTFDWTYDFTKAPGAQASQWNASGTHAFYAVNWLHDLYYGLGFDEASGNGQASNYGRGGKEDDAMHVEVQDYRTLNNATMAAHVDGNSPRMEMYVFTANTPSGVFVWGTGFDGGYGAGTGYGPNAYDVTGQLVVGKNGSGGGTDGCVGPLSNRAQISGGIALLSDAAGRCSHQAQVNAATDAGAQAIIVANPGNGYTNYLGLGPNDKPTVNMSADTAALLTSVLGGGTALTARVRHVVDVDRDAALDTTVVAHEWAHYLSNRLVGDSAGLTNSVARGMGEGWSDFNALLTDIKASDANVPSNAMWNGVWSEAPYAVTPASLADQNWYFGIRRFPYSADRTKNALTFKHVQDGVALPMLPVQPTNAPNSEIHDTGEVWCSTLFDAYVRLLNRLPFDEAQRRMRGYFVASLKATPVTPDFLEARDAWLAVAAAADPADLSDFVQAFAGRGMGLKATGPDRFSVDNHTVVEDFTTSATQAEVTSVTVVDDGPLYCDKDGILDVGEQGHVVVTLHNTGTTALPASTGAVQSTTAGVMLPGNGALAFGPVGPFATVTATAPITYAGARGPIAVSLKAIVTNPMLTAAVTKPVDLRFDADVVASDTETFEDQAQGWNTDWDTVTYGIGVEQVWQLFANSPVDNEILGPIPRWPAATYLISPPLQAGPGALTVTFKHRYQFRPGPDGGLLQLSVDGGNTWSDVPGGLLMPAYSGTMNGGTLNPLASKAAFVGQSPGYPTMQTQTVSFGTMYAGQTIQLRWSLGVDSNATGAGWELDDIQVTGLTALPFLAIGPDAAHCENRPPVANAGADRTVDEGTAVHLDGSASTDPDMQMLTLTWAQKSGPAVTLNGGDFTAPQVMGDTPLVFTLTASDGMLSATDDVTITVHDLDHPPVVTASGPAMVNAGAPAALTGTATDADNDPITVAWAQTAGTRVAITGANGLNASFIAPQTTQDLTFTLTATAAGVSVTSAAVTVHVNGTTMMPPPMDMPKKCGCGSAPGLAIALLALLVRRRHARRR
jgi:large repetitive protein